MATSSRLKPVSSGIMKGGQRKLWIQRNGDQDRALKLQDLMDKTYSKIDELRILLEKESKIIGSDMRGEMNPVLNRQQILNSQVMKTLDKVYGALEHKQPEVSSSISVNNNNSSNTTIVANTSNKVERKKWRLGDLIGSKERKKEDKVVRPSGLDPVVVLDSLKNKESDKESWYGSLDRNMSKKKRNYLERNRRHTKTVGSLGGLNVFDRVDELRPDEQYEIGLPSIATVRQRGGSMSRMKTMPRQIIEEKSLTPPPRPLKQSFYKPFHPIILPIEEFQAKDQMGDGWKIKNGDSNDSKSWFETNLDDDSVSIHTTSSVLMPHDSVSLSGISSNSYTRPIISSPTDVSEKSSSESSESKLNITKESTKPFEMADYYKYSKKYRNNGKPDNLEDSIRQAHQNSMNQTFPNENGTIVKESQTIALNQHPINSYPNNENRSDSNGNVLPKLPPKMSQLRNSGNNFIAQRPLPPIVDDGDSAWIMDKPTFV